MPKYRSSNYYAHPKKARSPRKPRAPPKKIEYEDDGEIIGLLPDDARLDLPTRTPRAASPMKFKNGTNVFKFDFEAPLAFPRRPLGMSLEEMYKVIVDGDGDGDDKPVQITTTKTTTKTTTPRKRQRDAEETSDGHDADDEKEVKAKQSARNDAKVTVAREVAGTKRRKLRV